MRPPGPSQLDGHPGADQIPALRAQGLGAKAIAKRLTNMAPDRKPVHESAVRGRLMRIAMAATRLANANNVSLQRATSEQNRATPLPTRRDGEMLPAIEAFGAELGDLTHRANRLLDQAESSVINPETGRADSAQLNAASGLIKSVLAVVRTRAELAGALGGAATNNHHPQVVIVFGGGMAGVQQAPEVREVGAGDVDWLDEG